jgi:hypothetical protein
MPPNNRTPGARARFARYRKTHRKQCRTRTLAWYRKHKHEVNDHHRDLRQRFRSAKPLTYQTLADVCILALDQLHTPLYRVVSSARSYLEKWETAEQMEKRLRKEGLIPCLTNPNHAKPPSTSTALKPGHHRAKPPRSKRR